MKERKKGAEEGTVNKAKNTEVRMLVLSEKNISKLKTLVSELNELINKLNL